MKYIKHEGSYYQKVELKKLSKEELIELISEAIEVKNKTVHEHHYNSIKGWYRNPIWEPYVTYTTGTNISNGIACSAGSVTLNKTAQSNLSATKLTSLASTLDSY